MTPRKNILKCVSGQENRSASPQRGEIWIAPEVLINQGFPNNSEGIVRLTLQLKSDLCFFSCGGFQPINLENRAISRAIAFARSFNLACGAVVDGPWQRLTKLEGCISLLHRIKKKPALLQKELKFQALQMGNEIEAWSEAGVDLILLADDVAYASGPYFSPEHFNQFLVIYYLQYINKFSSMNSTHIGFHSDGNLSLLMPALIDTGFSFFSLEPEATDIQTIWRHYGNHVAILSGIEAGWLITPSSTEKDRTDYSRGLDPILDQGNLILSSACGLFHQSSITALKKIYAYVDSYFHNKT